MQILKIPPLARTDSDTFVLDITVKAPDSVKIGQVLAVFQAAGEIVEVESPSDGTIAELAIYPGKMVRNGEPLLSLGTQVTNPQKTQSQQKETTMTQPTASGQVTPILMPQAGQSMEEGTILSWQIKEGDQIKEGQVICEIETDKATMEVESTHAGRVAKIVALEGAIVEVKQPIAFLADNDADVAAYLADQGQPSAPASAPQPEVPTLSSAAAPSPVTQPAVTHSGGRVKASPAARKIARQKGIDIAAIAAGSGPGGRIISYDVQTAIPATTASESKASTGTAVRRDLSKMRRAIAQNLLWSKQNVPHFYTRITIDASPLFSLYRKTKEQLKCSVNDFVTRACATVVAELPAFRSQYKDDHIMEHPSANIGIAVGTENGLTVPVVLNADRLSLRDLASQSRQVVENARNGKLEGIGQGVFTITNLGMFGVEEFSAIINPPESAILAVGAIREDVIVKDGAMRPGRVMTMVLSADHRVIDGTVAGIFAARIKELLEHPKQLL